MASKDPDDNCNTETEETIALMRKRARRVSFAETTAVHFFDRDEESDKTPRSAEAADGEGLGRTESDEIMALLQANGVCGEVEEEDDDDEVPMRKSFFRPIESPSPASSTFGSATSNDEENFFGPVSSDFIKRGLSNSAGSDDNHDITMDSTTFSMHFRSLAKSESGGEIKTPTGFRLAFGESTQTQTATSNIGNVMVLTGAKSPIAHLSPSVEKVRGTYDSNDMSLVGENPDRYDYGRLSPGLDALLAEDQRDVKAIPLSSQLEGSVSVDCLNKEKKLGTVYQSGTPLQLKGHKDLHTSCGTLQRPAKPVSPSLVNMEMANELRKPASADQRMLDVSFNEEYNPLNEKLNIGRIPVQMKDVSAGQESVRNAEKQRKRKPEFDPFGSQLELKSKDQAGSFLSGSISSLYSKRRHIFKDVSNSSGHKWNSTHLQKQPGSFSSKGSDRINFSLPLYEKGISRLKRLEAFPFDNVSKDGVNHTRVTSSDHFSKYHSKNSILEGKRLNDQRRYLDAPVACLEEQFFNVTRDSEKENTSNMNISAFKTPDQPAARRRSTGVANLIESEEERPSILATGSLNSKEWMAAGAPAHLTSLGNQKFENLLSTENAAEVNLRSKRNDSLLLEVNWNDSKYPKALPSKNEVEQALSESSNHQSNFLETPNELNAVNLSKDIRSIDNPSITFGSSSGTEQEPITSEPTESQQNLLETPKQPFAVILCGGGNSTANVNVAGNSSSETENPGLSVDCGESESALPSELDHSVNLAPDIMLNEQKTVLNNLQKIFQTPVRYEVSEPRQFCSSSEAIRTSSRSTILAEELPERSQCSQQEQYPQSSLDHPCSSVNDVLELRRTGDLTLDSNQLRRGNGCRDLQNAFHIIDGDYSSKVRNLDEKVGGYVEEPVEVPLLNKCQNFLNDHDLTGELQSGCSSGISTVTKKIGGDKGPVNLTDVFRNFNLLTETWFSSSVVKLDTYSIEKLVDIMGNLQKFAASKVICSEMYSQKFSEELVHAQTKRLADTKLLLYKALYGKVKVQLLHLKKKRLLNRINLLLSAVQESKLLKSKCSWKFHGSSQQDDGGRESQSKNVQEAIGESISTLKQALEDLDNKIDNLVDSFCTSLKIQRDPNCNKAIVFAMDHFKRKAPCWFLQHDLQLWEADSAEKKNGQLNVVLNYDRILSQRFKLKHKPKSSISISCEFSSARISKTWPNMNASTAFKFALSGNTTMNYTGPSIFAQETQRISSLLSNLHGVLEEIKLAQIELSNLAKTSFHLASVGRLDLQLFFINYDDGRRVILSLDVSCLNCGVYPSEIFPYEVRDVATGKQNSISQSLLDDIKAAIAGTRGGYMRILRLCRCISNVIHASNSMR